MRTMSESVRFLNKMRMKINQGSTLNQCGMWGMGRADDRPYGAGLLFWTQFDELRLSKGLLRC